MKLYEDTISQKEIYDGKIIHVTVDDVKLENGCMAKREVVNHNGGVGVVILSDQNEVTLVRQFRYPYKEVLLEIPAGKLEQGEEPFSAMKREQKEETGTTGKGYQFLGEIYPTPGYCNEVLYIWACRVGDFNMPDPDDDEFLEILSMPINDAIDMVFSGEIRDAKTQIGLLKTYKMIQDGLI